MANTLTPFNFGQFPVRTTTIGNAVWFVATDVAKALGYVSTKDAARHLDDDEKGSSTARTPGGDQTLTIINESGLYALVLRSRKPEARKFAKWVTSEVLPSIRKTGAYTAPAAAPAVLPPLPPADMELALLGAAAVAAQVQQAVFKALLSGGADWRHERWLLNFIPRDFDGDELVPNLRRVERGAYMGTAAQFPDFINDSLSVTNDTLQAIAAAAMQKLARRAGVRAVQQALPQERIE